MIVLDTNVVSELMRESPQQAVVDWFDAQHTNSLSITAITQAEILTGIELLPDGRRKNNLFQLADYFFHPYSLDAFLYLIVRQRPLMPKFLLSDER